jgi:hypothetical protein
MHPQQERERSNSVEALVSATIKAWSPNLSDACYVFNFIFANTMHCSWRLVTYPSYVCAVHLRRSQLSTMSRLMVLNVYHLMVLSAVDQFALANRTRPFL